MGWCITCRGRTKRFPVDGVAAVRPRHVVPTYLREPHFIWLMRYLLNKLGEKPSFYEYLCFPQWRHKKLGFLRPEILRRYLMRFE